MTSPEEAIEAITNSIESIDQDLVADALAGQVAAKATIEAWAVEMEAAALYYLAAKHGVQALGIMTISDSLVADEDTTAQERQTTFTDMMKVGLETLIAD